DIVGVLKNLKGTNVHTIDFSSNAIIWGSLDELYGYEPYKRPNLKENKVHTVNLSGNRIGPEGAVAVVQALQGTKVHTLYLSDNQIGGEGAIGLAKHLQGSSIHTLDLRCNNIQLKTRQLLIEQYPHIKWKL
ncbi:hypothetical protein GR268_42900, partial [Rhizobium leguminosarum]|nr:hypothetical protein [Rhizobium leguminosarum]